MSHQPFETWIFDHQHLAPQERRSLQSHLETCPQCQQTYRKWQAVQRELRTPQMIAPAPGFVARWQNSLLERRARQQRQQAWRIFLAFCFAALFVLLVMVATIMMTSSPSDWLAAFIQSISNSLGFFSFITYLARAWLANTPLVLNVALWVYASFVICSLSLVWIFALWRTSIAGVSNQ